MFDDDDDDSENITNGWIECDLLCSFVMHSRDRVRL